MMHTLLLAAAFQVGSPTSAPVQAPSAQMSVPPVYAESNRLAVTPVLDGKIDAEEWEPLGTSGALQSFFQWEPGKIHVAAKAAMGQDVLVSLDLAGDGWHAGADNLEIRVKFNGSAPEATVRRMSIPGEQGPTWLDGADYRAAMSLAAASDGASWTAELTIADPGIPMIPRAPGRKVGVRVDGLFANDPALDAYVPRAVPMVNLVWERGAGLPVGMKWKTEYQGRTVMPGEDIKIRYAFDGSDGLEMKRVELRTEGLGKNYTASQGIPFPSFDRKFRSFIDYRTKIDNASPTGWRVARATVFDQQDRPIVLQTSYEIAAPITFDFLDTVVVSSADQKNVKLTAYIRSNTTKRVTGVFKVTPPLGWAVESGTDKSFSLATPRGSKRQVFTLKVPAGYKGAAPFRLTAEMGPYRTEKTIWLVVQ